jgi:hypothetical protein
MHGQPVFAPNLNFNRYDITLNNLLSAMDDFQSKQLANPRNGRRTYLVTYSQADFKQVSKPRKFRSDA